MESKKGRRLKNWNDLQQLSSTLNPFYPLTVCLVTTGSYMAVSCQENKFELVHFILSFPPTLYFRVSESRERQVQLQKAGCSKRNCSKSLDQG